MYVVRGLVSYPDKSPAVGLKIVAFDKDIGGEDRLGEAVTDDKGGYRIEYDDARFRRSSKESRGADVFVRVLSASGGQLFESKTRRNAPQDYELNISLPVGQFAVRGTVLYFDNSPARGLNVTALDKDLRTEQELGSAVSQSDGTFAIRFKREDFTRAESGHADLIVRVFAQGKKNDVLLVEKIIPNSRAPETVVELVVGPAPEQKSEYERIALAIWPLLAGQGGGGADLGIGDLVPEDVSFLRKETGLGAELLGMFVDAQLAANQIPSPAKKSRESSGSALPPEFFYGLFRASLGNSLEQLVVQPRPVVQSALEWALERRIIPSVLEKEKLALLDAWDRFRAPLAVEREPAPGGISTGTVLGSLRTRLPMSVLDRVALLAARDGLLHEALVSELEKDEALSKAERESLPILRTAIAYAEVAAGNALLFKSMLSSSADLPDVSRPQDVVRFSRDHWLRVAKALPSSGQEPGSSSGSATQKADELMRRADAAYLSEAAQARLESGELDLSKEARATFDRLQKEHPAVKLAGSGDASIAHALSQAINKDAIPHQAALELLQVDGLLASTGNSLDVADVKRAGFRSVGEIVAAGRSRFTEKMTGKGTDPIELAWPVDRSNEVFDRYIKAAENGALAVIGAVARHASPPVAALRGMSTTAGGATTLAGLALSQGHCACESCRSVLSQAAYLADLLNFLRDAGQTQGRTPLEVLLQRRPDLQEVLLDCANEKIEVSYVDLVNEVLERAVVTSRDPEWLLLSSTSSGAVFVAELNQGTLPGSLAAELAVAGIRISAGASVEAVIPGARWRVRDDRWVVDLLNRSALLVSPPLPGVRAAPWPQSGELGEATDVPGMKHIMGAYDVLADAVYPWSMPFDLPNVSVRSILSARGLQEGDLRAVFGTGAQDDAADDAALSRLQLSARELRELASATPLAEADVALRWGFSDVAAQVDDPSPQFDSVTVRPRIVGWKAIVGRLSFLVERSRLEYSEVLGVLSAAFVNPAGTLRIVSVDPADPGTCDLRKLRLDGIADAQPFLAIYRFVRLLRATGLSVPELDTLLAAVGVPGWSATLKRLAIALQIRDRLKLPIRELSVLWADLGRRAYVEASHGQFRSLRSDYEEVFRATDTLAGLLPADPGSVTGWPTFDRLRDHLPESLGIGNQELDQWLALAGLSRAATASLGTLSKVYRNVILAKALDAPVEDFGRFLALLSEQPFNAAMPPLLRAVERVASRWGLYRALSASGDAVALALSFEVASNTEQEIRIAAVAQALHDQLKLLWNDPAPVREEQIVRTLSELADLDAISAKELAGRWLHAPRDRQLAANARLSVIGLLNDRQNWPPAGSPNPATSPIDRSTAPAVIEALTLFAKAAYLLRAIPVARKHWRWVFEHAASGGWLDLDLLPVRAADAGHHFEKLERLARWAKFWSAGEGVDAQALAYFAAIATSTRPAANQALAIELDIVPQQIDALAGIAAAAGAWGVVFPADYWDPRLAERLALASRLARRLKVEPAEPASWFRTTSQNFPDRLLVAGMIQSAVLASLEAPDRVRVQAEHARALRDACRNALVELLLHREQVADTGELFARYLIDVQMASEQRSTRMAQAVFAAQLFIQRMLMNLEPAARLTEADAVQWNQWRKWFRVWEANRKVFLYPENWLEPEFRDDKSPFFRELESDLQQSDLTSERAVVAFGTYLDKLGQVSRLELVAIHNETDDRGRDVTHLFARTRTGPVSYFYRRRIRNYAWTAWEKIEADVEGDFLIPVIHGKRLQLIWAIISEDARSGAGQSADAGSVEAWKVQFARSRRTESGWKAKELVGQAFTQPRLAGKEARDSFVFRSAALPTGEVSVLAFTAVERSIQTAIAQPAQLQFWPISQGENPFPTQVELKLVYATRQDVGIPGIVVTTSYKVGIIIIQEGLGTTNADGVVRFLAPLKSSRTMELKLSLNGNDLPWFFHSNDPYIGNYTNLLTSGGKGLWVDAPQYMSMKLPIIVTLIRHQFLPTHPAPWTGSRSKGCCVRLPVLWNVVPRTSMPCWKGRPIHLTAAWATGLWAPNCICPTPQRRRAC